MAHDRVTLSIRVSPNTHAAIKRMAEREELPVNTYVKETVLLRIGYNLGVEAGLLATGGTMTLEQDNAVREAVRDLIREWAEETS